MREPGGIGPHIGLKRLIAYRQGALPADEREEVQEHLSLCPRCTERLLELRDFEAASARGDAAGPESLQQAAWESLAQHLPRKGSVIRPITSAARREAPRRRVPAFVYAAAAALLLAVAGFAVWTAVTAQQDRQRLAQLEEQLREREDTLAALQRSLADAERQLAAARGQVQGLEEERIEPAGRVKELEAQVADLTSALEELRQSTRAPEARDRIAAATQQIAVSIAPRFALRGQEPTGSGFLRGGGAVNSVPAQGDRISVELTLADHTVYSEYRFELLDRDGQVLWTGRRPGKSLLGDAGTKVAFQGLSDGLYTLRIEGLRPDRTDLLAVYLLDVTRTAGPARD